MTSKLCPVLVVKPETVFEPFYSTKGFGVGLGLPLARNIARQHEGGLEVERADGDGTTMLLWIPAGARDG